ncbi:LysR family transcriptional regulator [Herbaspirillum robiniae]|uniref:LysR family transcriptional regulator n=1 Tax=Herbaspirillum robiniae TaxID=2014887 RepID=A0A246WWS7_9BURK|nr:LysR family transcriptional regulator [Herbaspirillum robiniae]NUU00105.1 LysR family transcriptional regulator [Herbaspirillum robiniae]OWY31442.1 LysR family transcriptional regulator [Herbaspirillum robiniae]
MVDLNDIWLFVQVVRAGSFAAAGRKLSMPPNTISRRLQALEAQVGVRLLQRSTRQLNMTAAGREFFERCAPGLEDIEHASASLTESTGEPSGSLRVAAPVDFFDNFSIEWMHEFMRLYPKVQLQFVLNDGRADLIAEGIDVAFRGGVLPDSSLVARKLVDSHRGLVASPRYLEHFGTPRTLADLVEHACLATSQAPQHTTWKLEGPQGPESVRVNPRLAINTAQGQLRAARAGLGIALLPTMLASEDLRNGTLVHILPDYQRDSMGLYAVYVHRRQLPSAVKALIDFFADKLERGIADKGAQVCQEHFDREEAAKLAKEAGVAAARRKQARQAERESAAEKAAV